MKQITSNVYVETGGHGCNIGFVVTSDGVVAHDTPVASVLVQAWLKEIAKHGPLRYVINGEGHPDHIGGNCWMGGILIAHEGARDAILKTDLNTLRQMQKRFAPDAPESSDLKLRTPDITLSQRLTIYLGKHTFRLMALPGHSRWQVTNYVPEEGVIFTSDNVVGTNMPFFFEAVPEEWLKTLEFIDTLDFAKLVPGHGEVKDKSYVKEMIKIVHRWIDPVKDAVKQGLALEETIKKVSAIKEFAELAKASTMPGPGIVVNSVTGIYTYYKNKK
jgi:cyclase